MVGTTATSAAPRPPRRRLRVERYASNGPQRLVFGVALVLVLGVGLVAGAVFLWPSGTGDDLRFNLGSLSYFPPGTVTTFVRRSDVPVPVGSRAAAAEPGESSSRQVPGTFHIVRLPDGELLALSAHDPHLGCTVPYRPTFRFNGSDGWFRNPCHGETYDMAGYRVFGPSPRGLDRFAVEVRDGNVHVDLGDLSKGPLYPPPHYEFQTGGVMGPLNER
jgi:nitrite reductase/ring-hydroxylating ferredoxin subunit